MLLAREPPLRSVSFFMESRHGSHSVAVRLADPIWDGGCSQRLELLVRCAQLQYLLERETAGSHVPTLEEVCATRPRVRELLESVHSGASAIAQQPGADTMELIDSSGLSGLCPLTAHFLGDPDKVRAPSRPALVPPTFPYRNCTRSLPRHARTRIDARRRRHRPAARAS